MFLLRFDARLKLFDLFTGLAFAIFSSFRSLLSFLFIFPCASIIARCPRCSLAAFLHDFLVDAGFFWSCSTTASSAFCQSLSGSTFSFVASIGCIISLIRDIGFPGMSPPSREREVIASLHSVSVHTNKGTKCMPH